MKKKIFVISLAVAVLAIAIIGGTLAWFTDEKEATNTFTVGDVSILLREPLWNGIDFDEEWEDVGYDPNRSPALGVDNAYNLVPGRLIGKDPQVKNDGKNACYVRLVLTSDDITTAEMWNAVISEVIQNQDTTNWDWSVDGSSVYVSYNAVLEPEGTTGPAFTGLKIDENATEADITSVFGGDGKLDLVVTAQAIQAEGFDGDSTAAWDAFEG
ncbi:MAG: hypothetical protein BWY11_01237 [Firmicutes bacterium ADurb.Bin182]|nr:MAG: hypothetical protein BWY11_01237 [Firmicutes bacterium ADurb.Bin182]